MTNSAYGADPQPFAGITTFMRQPATRDLQNHLASCRQSRL